MDSRRDRTESTVPVVNPKPAKAPVILAIDVNDWRDSSIDLRRGLDVIEWPAEDAFADTRPASL